MAVSNPASMSSVYAEFGAPAGTGLSAFLRGGAYVPNGPAANAGVPTALPIALSQLAGAVKYNFTASASPASVGGARATAGTAFTNATTCSTSGALGTVTYTWSVATTSGNAISVTSINSNTTTFSAPVSAANPTSTGTATCTAHDTATGANAVSNSVSITLNYAP